MDHLSVDRGLRGLKENLRTVNSEMKHNMSAFDRSDRSVAKYEASLTGLNKKLEVQKVAVSEAQKEYEKMVEQHGRGSKEAEKAARDYNNQAASLNNLERYIARTKDELVKFEREQRIANSSFTKLGDKLDKVGGKLKTAGTNISKVGSKMTKGITLPVVGAATAVGGLVAALGWKRLTSLDTAQAQLRGLGYSAKDVERISKDVAEAIEGGMTTFAEGTAVAAGALAAGVKEGKELQRYIKLVGDAAVGANRPVSEMAQIFNRVEGSGKLMTNELNSIEMSMPGFSKAMSKHLGVSSEKMRKMVTDGKVSSKDFLKVMDGFAGDMAKEYSKSWDGMVANTKAYIGIIGESFLQGIFQDSKKSLADFIEVLKSPEIQQRAAEMGEVARISFGKMKDSIMGVVEWYQNLDDGQKTMIKRLGLLAVAAGPVLQVTGKLTTGLGAVMQITGKLSTAIGVARGAGLAAGLASLGPLAVGGIAVAGLVAVGVSVYNLVKESKELEEVNLDVANSLTDQAIELEKSANSFDKLSGKAKLSNEQLAELNDLNIRISKSSNPGEIKALQEQYDALAKKSGLSKDELIRLFEANGDIIGQTPEVEKSVSDQGNAFAKNTEAVQEYIASLYEVSLIELDNQREQALINEVKLKKDITKQQDELNSLLGEMGEYNKEIKMSDEERMARIGEIREIYKDVNVSHDEKNELVAEEARLMDIQTGYYAKNTAELVAQIEEKRESIGKSEEELVLVQALDMEMANIVLKQVGINEEGDKGLAKLDEVIAKNNEELTKLDQKLEKNGKLSEEEQKRYEKLTATNEKHEEAKTYLNEELGLYKDLNSLAEGKLNKADAETKKKIESLAKTSEIKVEEGNIVEQIQKKNTEYDKAIEKLGQQKKEEGANKKEIEKQITALQNKKVQNDEVIKKILIELGVWDQVKDSIESGTKKEKEKGNAATETKTKLDSQGKSIDNNNKKTDAGVKKEQERSKEAGKDVDKKVDVKDYGSVARLNLNATEKKEKFVTLNPGSSLMTLNRQASSPVSKTINFIGKGLEKLKFWAKGTPPQGHPGGMAVVGDGGGRELIKTPGGATFLSPSTDTMMDLPKGTHVIPHRKTERLLKSAPRYARGTNDWQGLFDYENLKDNEFMKLLALNNKQTLKVEHEIENSGLENKIESLERTLGKLIDYTAQMLQVQQTQMVVTSERPIILQGDGRELARFVKDPLNEINERDEQRPNRFRRG